MSLGLRTSFAPKTVHHKKAPLELLLCLTLQSLISDYIFPFRKSILFHSPLKSFLSHFTFQKAQLFSCSMDRIGLTRLSAPYSFRSFTKNSIHPLLCFHSRVRLLRKFQNPFGLPEFPRGKKGGCVHFPTSYGNELVGLKLSRLFLKAPLRRSKNLFSFFYYFKVLILRI